MGSREPVDDDPSRAMEEWVDQRFQPHHSAFMSVPSYALDFSPRRMNVLLAATGSVACVKVPQLVELLRRTNAGNCHVKVLLSERAKAFVTVQDIAKYVSGAGTSQEGGGGEGAGPLGAFDPVTDVLGDADEWKSWRGLGDPVLHIELRKWADVLVVAPLSANTLGKFANGLCDSLITSVFRAWDFKSLHWKPVVVAPAMNTMMWESPITGQQLDALTKTFIDINIVGPVCKQLACKDTGMGALAPPEDICSQVGKSLQSSGLRRGFVKGADRARGQ